MELLGALIGIRSLLFVKEEIKLEIDKLFLWSDSKCVLYWITTLTKGKKFVENRLREVRRSDVTYRFVPTAQNPADIGTRGMMPEQLRKCRIWWDGPPFLLLKEEDWPKTDIPKEPPAEIGEEFSTYSEYEMGIIDSVMTFSGNAVEVYDPKLFDTWKKLCKTIALTCRFIKKLKKFKGGLDASDVLAGENIIIRQTQSMNPPTNKEVKDLNIVYNNEGILVCQGRFDPNMCLPIYLPRQAYETILIVIDAHRRVMHMGLQATLCRIRETFWLPRGRAVVKRIIRRYCMICKRLNAKPYALPPMANLPKERITRESAFINVGLDFMGPIMIKVRTENERKKVWINLYTCMCTRATHLEVVSSLSAEAFLNALRRFIARKGKPVLIISDNAPQFKLVARLLDSVWPTDGWPDIENYLACEKIKWKNIPEFSPWFGGFYERLVGIVKKAFIAAVGRRILIMDDFITLVAEAEAVVNSRPLTYLYEKLEDCKVIRPADFINPGVKFGTPMLEENHDDIEFVPNENSRQKLLKFWRRSQQAPDKLWNIYYKEYIISLRERFEREHKAKRSIQNSAPKLGEVVLVEEHGAPRGEWRLAKILEIKGGNDNYIRVARVKMANGNVLTRPINQL